jgi:DivIVA domain-containing protein
MNQNDPERRIAELARGGCLTPAQVHNVAFAKPAIGKRGYNEDEVDAFLDRVEAALQDPTGRALTPEQVRNAAFSKPPFGFRGYNQAEVDAFLELVEQQLRSQPGAHPLSSQVAFPPPPMGRLPTTHAAGPQSWGSRIIDVVSNVLGSFWLWYLLGMALLVGGGVGLH